MKFRLLPFKNIVNQPVRSFALIMMVMLLSMSMLGGTLITQSLRRGLNSLETRLGADVIVVPDEAASKKDLESILLDGVPGYFYMDRKYYDEIANKEGIRKISAQYYLASTKAGCCSMPIQIIGYDPDTDFTVTPWIKENGADRPGMYEIVAGYDINSDIGGTIRFFDRECKVVAKLDKTGTQLDNAVYTGYDTIKALIDASKENSFKFFSEQNPDDIVSSILIDVEDGYDIQSVVDDINVHEKKVQAVATKNMLSGVSDSLGGISDVTRILVVTLWILILIILIIYFSSMIHVRRKEFAILRVMGVSQKMMAKIVFMESIIISVVGAMAGMILTVIMIYPFSNLISQQTGLPFLTPSAGNVAVNVAVTFLVIVAAGTLTAAYEALSLSKTDAGLVLREEN